MSNLEYFSGEKQLILPAQLEGYFPMDQATLDTVVEKIIANPPKTYQEELNSLAPYDAFPSLPFTRIIWLEKNDPNLSDREKTMVLAGALTARMILSRQADTNPDTPGIGWFTQVAVNRYIQKIKSQGEKRGADNLGIAIQNAQFRFELEHPDVARAIGTIGNYYNHAIEFDGYFIPSFLDTFQFLKENATERVTATQKSRQEIAQLKEEQWRVPRLAVKMGASFQPFLQEKSNSERTHTKDLSPEIEEAKRESHAMKALAEMALMGTLGSEDTEEEGEKWILDKSHWPEGRQTPIILEGVGDLPAIPLYIDLNPNSGASEALQPFSPEKGYPVTSDDFDPEKRKKKYYDRLRRYGTPNDPGLVLVCQTRILDLPDSGIGKRNTWRHNFFECSDTERNQLKRLRLKIDANGATCESRADISRDGDLKFLYFYPTETGPLADWDGNSGKIGQILCLPDTNEELRTVTALFYLAEQDQENESIEK